MGSCHFSRSVLQNQTFCRISSYVATFAASVLSFVHIAIHFHPLHRYLVSHPKGFVSFLQFFSTQSNHYCRVSTYLAMISASVLNFVHITIHFHPLHRPSSLLIVTPRGSRHFCSSLQNQTIIAGFPDISL